MAELNRSTYRRLASVIGGVGLVSLAAFVVANLSAHRPARTKVGRGRVLRSSHFTSMTAADGHLGAREPEYDWARSRS